MESLYSVKRRSFLGIATAIAVAVPAAGCGGEEDDYANDPRPAAPITISARIGDDGIDVSPRKFGAGPITLIISNQTERDQEVTLETDEIGGSAPGIEQNSGPISPGDTASLKADLRKGTYTLGVGTRAIRAVTINVGADRPSAQNELLQP